MAERHCDRLALLDADDAARWAATVHALRPHWRPRHPDAPFFTLGAASYLDAGEGEAAYRDAAGASNPLLQEHVAPLLERLRARLAILLEAPVAFSPGKALPGFHVFGGDPRFEKPFASIHADRQYRRLDWQAFGEVDESATLSITLPLQLPASGGGLRLWALDGLAVERMDEATRRATLASAAPAEDVRYRVGEAVVHDGHLLHQIAPLGTTAPGEWRITLQAHGLRFPDAWHLYW